MTSRERILAAVDCEPVDRVPARFNCPPDELARRVARELGLPDGDDWFETLQQRLRTDMRMVDLHATCGYGGDRLCMVEAKTAADVDRLWPDKWRIENRTLDHSLALIESWDASGNPPAVQVRLADLFDMVRRMRGDTQALIDMAEENAVFGRIIERMIEFNTQAVDMAYLTLGDRLDLVYLLLELGMQTGLMYHPDAIRKHFWPPLGDLFARVHDSGAKVFFHSCGAIEPLIPDLIDLGVDVLNPVQPNVPGMDPEHLAERFGGRLCFCGGLDMQDLLPNGTPKQVRGEVARYARALGPGYILDLANIMHPDIPTANIQAMYDAPRAL